MKVKVKIDPERLGRFIHADREQAILENFQKGMRAAALELREYAWAGFGEILKRMRRAELIAKIRSLKARGLL